MNKRVNNGQNLNNIRNFAKKNSNKLKLTTNKTIQDSFENNNCKPFWRYMKAKKQDNIGVTPLKRKGNLFSNPRGTNIWIGIVKFYLGSDE